MSGCEGAEDTAQGDGDAGATSHDAAVDAGGEADAEVIARVSSGCRDRADWEGGDIQGGIGAQNYILHIPPGYTGEPAPLVINLHGFLSNSGEQPGLSGMSALADEEGFLVAYINGGGGLSTWNAGDCCEYEDTTRDDVAFIAEFLDSMESTACIDLTRVYVTGFSMGGFFAHRLGCELSDRFAAIASVAGVLGIPPEACQPTRPLPVLQIHGDADSTVPYMGGSPMGWELLFPSLPAPTFRSAAATLEFWRDHDGCAAESKPGYSMGDATCVIYDGCDDDSEVELCTISGGGHAWPGGDPSYLTRMVNGIPLSALTGNTSTSLDASRHIWEFFERHTLP